MKKLILASNSAQRKKLLKMLGLKFIVRPSHAQELQKIKTTCQDLVKHNAFLKASSVASQLKDGLVIGSDSVVYVGGKKIIGKPKDLKDAKRILKILFSRPHWVYTGIAVIDVKSGKKIVDYDKTKIFMTPLSDEEIDCYHQKMKPFDKAGGFDIEGYGSLFIRRIEGCYTNVIGLPIAKLAQILRKFGIFILKDF